MSLTARLRALLRRRGGSIAAPPPLGPDEARAILSPANARCSRCDREVPASELRPWSELRMRCCPDCDSELTGLIFPDPSSPEYDPDTHRGYLAAYREAREA